VLGTKYKGAWDKINRAKKLLSNMGWEAPTELAATDSPKTPKKRKVEENHGTAEVTTAGDMKKAASKGGSSKAKKVKKEESYGEDSAGA